MSDGKKYDAHVFICTSCTYKGSDEEICEADTAAKFRKAVKKEGQERYPKGGPGPQVRINASGCLGQCEHGISCVIYPQNQWLLNLRPDSSREVWEALESALHPAP